MDPIAAIALSGMTAATQGLDAVASNVANMNDAAPPSGPPAYQPKAVVNTSAPGGGVTTKVVTLKPASFLAYDPLSPVADAAGLVSLPEIDPISEVTNQLQAGHAYAFSAETLEADEETQQSLLDIET